MNETSAQKEEPKTLSKYARELLDAFNNAVAGRSGVTPANLNEYARLAEAKRESERKEIPKEVPRENTREDPKKVVPRTQEKFKPSETRLASLTPIATPELVTSAAAKQIGALADLLERPTPNFKKWVETGAA
ncbi:MAG: hypothetical protein Q7S22_04125 [Candidatus Micrarchaeota archaeon]|nr:hypothetical protein [Candidatus Micrarchaeota archaeon]